MRDEKLLRTKGVQKKQVLWKNTIINDHVFEQDLEAATQEVDDLLAALSRKMISEVATVKKGTIRIPLRIIQVPKTFNFASFWERLQSNKFLQSLASLLSLKDLLSLLSSSKQVSRTIIKDELWKLLLNRDFPGMKIEEDALNYISVKQYYMFLGLTKKPSLFHHTGLIVREGPPKEFGLIRNLIDFCSTKSLKRVLNMKLGVEIPKDMKLSWLKDQNKLVMWIEIGNDWCKIIHVYELPEEEKIKRAFFLDEKYLVVETSQEEWEQTMRVYDIAKDMMNLITKNGDPEALSVVFNRKTLAAAMNEKEVIEKEETVKQTIVEVENESLGKLALGVKMLEDDLVVFYEKNRVNPLFVLMEMSSGKKISQENLKMDSMLYEALVPKRSQEKKLYLLDYQLNVYCINFKATEPSQYEKIFETNHQEASKLMDDNVTLYHHGVISSSSDSSTIEYLTILDDKNHFNFINLESKKVHKYNANPKGLNYEISNWNINGDNLMWLNKSITNLAKIAWQDGDFTIRKLGFQSTDDCRDNSSIGREWILINPCYTLHITTFVKKGQNSTKLRITILSTQKFILNTIYGHVTSFFDETGMAALFDQIFYQSYDVDNMLSELQYDRQKEGKGLQGEFLFKFEGEKLMIKNSDYCLYFDLERFWRQNQFVTNKWQGGIAKLDICTLWNYRKMIPKQNNLTGNGDSQEKNKGVIAKAKKMKEEKIKENKNGVGKEPKNKSKGWKKPVPQKIKDEIKAANVIRHKGYKYYKIVRRDGRNEKWQNAEDIEAIGGNGREYYSGEEDLLSTENTEDEEFDFESEYSF